MKKIDRRSLVGFIPMIPLTAMVDTDFLHPFFNWFAPPRNDAIPENRRLNTRSYIEDLLASPVLDEALEVRFPETRGTIQRFERLRDLVAKEYANGDDIRVGLDAYCGLMAVGAIQSTFKGTDEKNYVGRFLNKNKVYFLV